MRTRDIYRETESLAIGETARLLGVSVDTVREWERQGVIASSRTPGNQRRFRRSDVEALLSGERAS